MGKYDDAIGSVELKVSVTEILNEDAAKKVDDQIKKQKAEWSEPVTIDVEDKTAVNKLKELSKLANAVKKDLNDAISSKKSLTEVNKIIKKYEQIDKEVGTLSTNVDKGNNSLKETQKILRDTKKLIDSIAVSEEKIVKTRAKKPKKGADNAVLPDKTNVVDKSAINQQKELTDSIIETSKVEEKAAKITLRTQQEINAELEKERELLKDIEAQQDKNDKAREAFKRKQANYGKEVLGVDVTVYDTDKLKAATQALNELNYKTAKRNKLEAEYLKLKKMASDSYVGAYGAGQYFYSDINDFIEKLPAMKRLHQLFEVDGIKNIKATEFSTNDIKQQFADVVKEIQNHIGRAKHYMSWGSDVEDQVFKKLEDEELRLNGEMQRLIDEREDALKRISALRQEELDLIKQIGQEEKKNADVVSTGTQDQIKDQIENQEKLNDAIDETIDKRQEEAKATEKLAESKSKYYEIDEKAARLSKQMRSFDDYKEGSATASYRAAVDEMAAIVEEKKQQYPNQSDKLDKLLDRYAKNLAQFINKDNQIGAQYPSVMISGAGNYNIRKHDKQMASWGKNFQFYDDKVLALENQIRNLGGSGKEVIRGDEKDALEKLEAKVEYMKYWHQVMIEANKFYRKNKTLEGFEGSEPDELEAIQKALATQQQLGMHDVPYPQYALTNDNQNIKRLEGRIKELKRLKSDTSSSNDLQEANEFYKLWIDKQDMRIRISFEMGKPDQEIIDILKGKAFKWSPKNNAWQRQLTNNAVYTTKQLQKSLHEFYQIEDQAQAATEAIEGQIEATEKLAQEHLKLTPKKDGNYTVPETYTALDGKYEISNGTNGWEVYQRDNAGLYNLIGAYKHLDDVRKDSSLLTREEIIRTDEVVQAIHDFQEAYRLLSNEIRSHMPVVNKYLELLDGVKNGTISATKASMQMNKFLETLDLNALMGNAGQTPADSAQEEVAESIEENTDGLLKQAESLDEVINVLAKLDSISADPLNEIIRSIVDGEATISSEVQAILKSLNLLDDAGNFSGEFITAGGNNRGVVTNGKYAIIARHQAYYDELETHEFDLEEGTTYFDMLIAKEKEAAEQGVDLARILARVKSEAANGKGLFYEIQELASGEPIHVFDPEGTEESLQVFEQACARIVGATDEQLQKLMSDVIKLNELGFLIDFNPENVLHDATKGFTRIDFELRDLGRSAKTTTELMESFFWCLTDFENYQIRLDEGIEDVDRWGAAIASVYNRLHEVFKQNEWGVNIDDITASFGDDFAKYIVPQSIQATEEVKKLTSSYEGLVEAVEEFYNAHAQVRVHTGGMDKEYWRLSGIENEKRNQLIDLVIPQNTKASSMLYQSLSTSLNRREHKKKQPASPGDILKIVEKGIDNFHKEQAQKDRIQEIFAIADKYKDASFVEGELFNEDELHQRIDDIQTLISQLQLLKTELRELNVYEIEREHVLHINGYHPSYEIYMNAWETLDEAIKNKTSDLNLYNSQLNDIVSAGAQTETSNTIKEAIQQEQQFQDTIEETTESIKEQEKVLESISEEVSQVLKGIDFKQFFKNWGIPQDASDGLMSQFQGLAQALLDEKSGQLGDYSVNIGDKLEDLFGSAIESASILVPVEKHLQEFYDFMKGQKVKYDESYIKEFGQDDWKRILNPNRKLLSKQDGLSADSLYEELSDLFPHLFPGGEDTPNVYDQFRLIFDTLAEARIERKKGKTERIALPNEYVGGLGDEIIGMFNTMQVNVAQIAPSIEAATEAENEFGDAVEKNNDKLDEQSKKTKNVGSALEDALGDFDDEENGEDDLEALILETFKDSAKMVKLISSAAGKSAATKFLEGITSESDLQERIVGYFNEIFKRDDWKFKEGKGVWSVKGDTYKAHLVNSAQDELNAVFKLKEDTLKLQSNLTELRGANIKDTFDVGGHIDRATAAVENLSSSLHGLEYDLTDLETAANNIKSKDDWDKFNNQLKATKDRIQAIKNATVSQSSLDKLANMQRDMKNADTDLETLRLQLEKFGDIDGIDKARAALEAMTSAAKKFKEATTAEEQKSAYGLYSENESVYKSQTSHLEALQRAQRRQQIEQEKLNAARAEVWKNEFQNNYKYNNGKTASDQNELDRMSEFYRAQEAEAIKAEAAAKQQKQDVQTQYKEILDLVNKINSVDNEILKFQEKDGGSGLFSGYIKGLQAQKSELLNQLDSVKDSINKTLGEGFVLGKEYSIPSVSFLSEETSGTIADFLSSTKTQASLTTEEIEKLVAALQKAQKIDVEAAAKVTEQFKSVQDTYKKITELSTLDQGSDIYKNTGDIFKMIMYYKDTLSKDPTQWTPEEAANLQTLIDKFNEYGNVLVQVGQKEAQYFAGKTKYAEGTSMSSMAEDAEKAATKADSAKQKLTEAAQAFAKESNASGAIITNFTQTADGMSKLDFSVFDKETNTLRNFRMEMGRVTEGVYVAETGISKSLAKIKAAQKQLGSMGDLIVGLGASGIDTNPETATGSVAKLVGLYKELSMLTAQGEGADQGLLAETMRKAKLATAEVEKLYKEFLQLEDFDGMKIDLGKIKDTANAHKQLSQSIKEWASNNGYVVDSIGKLNEKTGKVKFTLIDTDGTIREFTANVKTLGDTIIAQESGVTQYATIWDRLKASISKTGKQFLTAFAGANVFYRVLSEIRKGYGYVKEIDSAMTELKKVTDETETSYRRFLETASKTAGAIGSTVSDFTAATANFARLGYTMQESAKMAETAIVYKNVAD